MTRRVSAADDSVRVQGAGFGGEDSVREWRRRAGLGSLPLVGARGRGSRVPGRFKARRGRVGRER